MNKSNQIVLKLDDEARRLSKLAGVPVDIAYQFVLAEDKFFDLKGLNDYGEDDYIEPEDTVIDVDEMLTFIASETGISNQICYRLEDAERKYFTEIGIMDPEDYEGEFAD